MLAHRVELHDYVRPIARHWTARAQWSINRVLQLELAATDVVRDVDDLHLACRRGDEGQSVGRGRQCSVGARRERDAGPVVGRVVLALETKVEWISCHREVR